MPENLNTFTRWDAMHKASIVIKKADMKEVLKQEFLGSGFTFLTTKKHIAESFGVGVFGGDLQEFATNVDFKKDVASFALGFDQDEGFQLACSSFDLDCDFVGLFVIDEKSWLEAYPAYKFGYDCIYDILLVTVVELANFDYQNRCFEALIDECGDNSFCSRLGYRSPEEALVDAIEEFPEIIYCEDDFELVKGQYQLKTDL